MRLVKNRLKTEDWNILNYLKENAIGLENAISSKLLSAHFGISKQMLRYRIRNIRKNQEIVIGSNIKTGYYIPLQKEKDEALRYAENKTLSELETRIIQNPEFVLKAFKTINETLKTTDKAPQGQIKMKLSGYENEIVNYFGDKYLENIK